MPIRLNLLAEQQAAEEERRRDPVKRGYWVAGLIVALVLLWSLYLQMQNWRTGSELRRLDRDWRSLEAKTSQVRTNMKTINELVEKLDRLRELSTNRYLWGSVMNALQYSMVDSIEILQIKADQKYILTPEVKAKSGTTSKGSPATSTEKVVFTIEGKCYGGGADEKIELFRRSLRSQESLKAALTNDNMIRPVFVSQPEQDLGETNQIYVRFTLECLFPEKTRL